jgi:sigma-B regulation protein RsbU (phosphoserine phosphatase)
MPTPDNRGLLRRLHPLDRIALAIATLFLIVTLARLAGYSLPFAGFVQFAFFLSLGYLVYRFSSWARTRLLWSLRNRLIVAFLFFAGVPVVMLLAMGAITARMLFQQLGGYLLVQDIQARVVEVANTADSVASAMAVTPQTNRAAPIVPPVLQGHLARVEGDLPGLELDMKSPGKYLASSKASSGTRFSGIVQSQGQLWLVGEVRRGQSTITARAPVTPELLDRIAPFLGPLQLVMTHPATDDDPANTILHLGGLRYGPGKRVTTPSRKLQGPASWFDFQVDGVSNLDAQLETPNGLVPSPVFASFSTRAAPLYGRIFSSLGDLSSYYVEVLIAIGFVFLLLEAVAFITGIVLTRTITHSVSELYHATQYAQAGDFSHRVRVERADQLGALADSFNAMAGSVGTLIEEQRKRQRLENEISIAHEVQSQLFPRTMPAVPGIEFDASCRPARGVSGDYYDFLPLGATRLGFALADISGKGISAALLMASVQAALRSQLLLDGNVPASTAEIVGRINRHLYLNTTEDRYATFFFAIYDSSEGVLRYTNAGHPAPFCISGGQVNRLEVGGTVVGVFDDYQYEEGVVQVEPGSLLVIFSDGLVEPENVYGEEFGSRRLADVALRDRQASAHDLVESLLGAAEEWAGTAEQADDMTVIVARLSKALN